MKLFRYEENYYSYTIDSEQERYGTKISLELETYPIIKETDKSYLLDLGFATKWIRKGAKREWASQTKERALEQFLLRKRAQKRILTNKLKETEQLIELGERIGWRKKVESHPLLKK